MKIITTLLFLAATVTAFSQGSQGIKVSSLPTALAIKSTDKIQMVISNANGSVSNALATPPQIVTAGGGVRDGSSNVTFVNVHFTGTLPMTNLPPGLVTNLPANLLTNGCALSNLNFSVAVRTNFSTTNFAGYLPVTANGNQIFLLFSTNVPGGVSGGGGSCTTVAQQATGTGVGGVYAGKDHSAEGSVFTANASDTVCTVDLSIKKIGTPSGTLRVGVFADSSGVPGSQVGTWSSTVASGAITGSYATVTFSGLSAARTSGTTYWLVVESGSTDGSNYYQLDAGGSYGSGTTVDGTVASSWAYSGSYAMFYTLYK